MKEPLVSIIIPTYKRIEKVIRGVRSVFNQTYNKIEIIVVNDDPNIKLEKYIVKRKNLYIINHDKRKGGSAARNTGIKLANGKYIAFLDDDDIFLQHKIQKLVKVMESLSEEWIGAYSWWISKGTRKIKTSSVEGDLTFELLSMSKKFSFGGSSSLFIRKDILMELEGFNENYKRHQDWEFLLRLFRFGRLKLIPEALFLKEENPSIPLAIHLSSKIKFLKEFSDIIFSFGKRKTRKIYCIQLCHLAFKYFDEKKWKEGLKIIKNLIIYAPYFTVKEIFHNIIGKLYFIYTHYI